MDLKSQRKVRLVRRIYILIFWDGKLSHWDVPQACHDQYGSWTDPKIVTDFVNYADVIFQKFAPKVKYWLTLNEPTNICYYAYNAGTFAPNVKMGRQGQYLCGHHQILATAYTVKLAKEKYSDLKISFPTVMSYGEPQNPNSDADIQAGIRSMEFTGGWMLNPFFKGDYPASMRSDPILGSLLPVFTDADKEALRLGLPFIAFNYYTSYYITVAQNEPGQYTSTPKGLNGQDIGPKTGIDWQYVFPQGLRKSLGWLSKTYPSVKIWVSEVGCAGPNEENVAPTEAAKDDFRIDFMNQHLKVIEEATSQDNIEVEAVLVWSLLDNWEWQFGYGPRFGVVSVDFNSGSLQRTVKKSAMWLKDYFSYAPARTPLALVGGNGQNGTTSATPGQTSSKNHAQSLSSLSIIGLFLLSLFLLL